MVKVLFIVEGKVEKIFIDYLENSGWFRENSIEKIGPTIDARGGGNLCPENIRVFIEEAKTHNPDKIVILTDLECDPCVEKTKSRLGSCDICTIIIAKKTIEAWFLADSKLLAKISDNHCTQYGYPETTSRKPFETIKVLAKRLKIRGPGMKAAFAKKVMKNGFDIEKAAAHSDCSSARYFIDKMREISASSSF